MRNLKKFLALILAFMMTFSLMVTVNAADTSKDFTDGVTEKFVEGVKVLNGMKVFRGYEDGSFNPKGEITRAEVAAIVYRLATGDYNDTQSHLYKDYVNFDDVHSTDWFAGYVNYCANAQWIEGYGNGKFGPNDKVTGYQAAAMILRAVGYGKNNEFKGASWQVQVANVTRSEGLLVNVDNTNYANTLNSPATRELIAEILFQAAQIPTVTWTMLNGYNKYTTPLGVNGELNPSLGVKNYGLTAHTGIIVGNQATGEARTKVGMSIYNISKDATPVWAYNGSSYTYASANDGTKGNVTLAYSIETNLDLFGHKATVWFDNRSDRATENTTGLDTNFATSYAVIDKATLVKTVWANDTDKDSKSSDSTRTSIYTAAVAAGFHKNSAPVYESDRFCQIGKDTTLDDAIQSKVGMYRIISNNSLKTADVVISLNQEVAQITQVNTTVKDGEYIYLGTGSSRFGDTLTGGLGLILDDLLAPGSDKTLGDVVTVNEIVGTTFSNLDALDNGDDPAYTRTVTNAVNFNADNGNTKYCLYETSKLEPAFTGTVSTYKCGTSDVDNTTLGLGAGSPAENVVTKVTLTDGKSYDLSGITGSHYDYGFDTTPDSHLIDKAVTPLTNKSIAAGVTYSFYMDELGRFIGVGSASDYSFLYTTFADYEIGGLGTGTISYYAYGVDWNGNIVKTNNQISSIRLPVDTTDPDGKLSFNEGNGPQKYSVGAGTLATGYNLLPITKKDQGTASGGNQINNGANTRFVLDGKGNLSWYREGVKDYGERFIGWNNSGSASGTWTINANDARNGFKRVYSASDPADSSTNTDYLLTNDTKFIVVTGSGTSDLSVKTYKGLTELLAGGTSADITYTTGKDNVYFITGEQRYGNVDTNANRTVDTVILSDTNLNQYGVQSLYFAAPQSEATGVKLAGEEASPYTINQYKLYNNGVAGYYWVADDAPGSEPAGAGDSDNTTGIANTDTGARDKDGGTDAGKGKFFTLTKISEISGQPIYRAVEADPYNNDTAGKNVDQVYNYIVVNNVNTADIGDKVFKVGNAVVTEAYGENEPLIESNGIDTVEKLNNAVSMGKAGTSGNLYEVHVAIVYDGIDVANIYVTNIVPPTP